MLFCTTIFFEPVEIEQGQDRTKPSQKASLQKPLKTEMQHLPWCPFSDSSCHFPRLLLWQQEEIERADTLFWVQKAPFWQGTASFGQGESVCSHFSPGRILGELRPDLPEGCQEDAAGLRMLNPTSPGGTQQVHNCRETPETHDNQAGRRKSSSPELGWVLQALP